MNRLWGQAIAAALITWAFGLFAPDALKESTWGALLVAIVVVALLGSGALAGLFDVDKWPDRGWIVGTAWGLAGAVISGWIFGSGAWYHGPAGADAFDIFTSRFHCLFPVGNAIPSGCLAQPSDFPAISFGAIVWPIVHDFAVLAVGMGIVGAPLYFVLALSGGRKQKEAPPS